MELKRFCGISLLFFVIILNHFLAFHPLRTEREDEVKKYFGTYAIFGHYLMNNVYLWALKFAGNFIVISLHKILPMAQKTTFTVDEKLCQKIFGHGLKVFT